MFVNTFGKMRAHEIVRDEAHIDVDEIAIANIPTGHYRYANILRFELAAV